MAAAAPAAKTTTKINRNQSSYLVLHLVVVEGNVFVVLVVLVDEVVVHAVDVVVGGGPLGLDVHRLAR